VAKPFLKRAGVCVLFQKSSRAIPPSIVATRAFSPILRHPKPALMSHNFSIIRDIFLSRASLPVSC